MGCNLDTLLTNASKILFQQIVLPSIINEGPINEIQLNFLGTDNRKLPMVVLLNAMKLIITGYFGVVILLSKETS